MGFQKKSITWEVEITCLKDITVSIAMWRWGVISESQSVSNADWWHGTTRPAISIHPFQKNPMFAIFMSVVRIVINA